MDHDVKSIIFYGLALIIVLACIFAMEKIFQVFPLDYSKQSYSYKRVLRGGLIGLLLSLLSSLLIYIFSKSHELALTIGVIFVSFTVVYVVWGFYFQRWQKARGAGKED